MRIITLNVNGVRSAARKGFFSWLAKQDADIVCLQETKVQREQLSDPLFFPEGYYSYYSDAEKKGYSGVAIYSRIEPDSVQSGFGFALADSEGRYIQANFGKLSIASVYLPSGTSGEHRQAIKYDFMDKFRIFLDSLCETDQEYIIVGDWNIAHKNIDVKNWKTNQKTTGFLPEERAWIDKLFSCGKFFDAFRIINQEPEQFTWWSQRSLTTFERNIGWRLDYQVITKGLKDKITNATIYKGERFSDHAPLIMDYDL